MSKYSKIVEREFRRKGFHTVKCDDSQPELFTVEADGDIYVCEVGSDDDCFTFTRSRGGTVIFDIPKDWA